LLIELWTQRGRMFQWEFISVKELKNIVDFSAARAASYDFVKINCTMYTRLSTRIIRVTRLKILPGEFVVAFSSRPEYPWNWIVFSD
jgi:hypothetical protein